MTEPVAGWYPDPSGDTSKIRYWDGSNWTEHYQDSAGAVPASGGYNQASEQPSGVDYNQSAPAAPGYGQPQGGYGQSQGGYDQSPGESNSGYPAWQSEAPAPPNYNQAPNYQNQSAGSYYVQPVQPVKDNKLQALLSIIFAAVGLALSVIAFFIAGTSGGRGGSELVIGLTFLLGFAMAIPTIIMAIFGLKSSRRGLAITALVLGIVGILAFVGLMALGIWAMNNM